MSQLVEYIFSQILQWNEYFIFGVKVSKPHQDTMNFLTINQNYEIIITMNFLTYLLYIRHILLVARQSHLSGCFWPFTPNFARDLLIIFILKNECSWSSVDTQTLLKKNFVHSHAVGRQNVGNFPQLPSTTIFSIPYE